MRTRGKWADIPKRWNTMNREHRKNKAKRGAQNSKNKGKGTSGCLGDAGKLRGFSGVSNEGINLSGKTSMKVVVPQDRTSGLRFSLYGGETKKVQWGDWILSWI